MLIKCLLLFIFSILFLLINYTPTAVEDKPQSIVIAIVSCPKDYKTVSLNLSKLPFDYEVLMCNKATNSYDAREGGIMLDYIIKNYNRKKYNTVLFIHDHDKANHYPDSITERINKLLHEKYIYERDFVGINCRYIQFNVGNNYEHVFHDVEKVDKYYLRYTDIDYVKMSEVHDNKYIFPCCASFFVSTKLFLLHPLHYYISLRNALRNFSIYGFNKFISYDYLRIKYRNYMAACYLEFVWSTMFGQKNVSLPPDCTEIYNF